MCARSRLTAKASQARLRRGGITTMGSILDPARRRRSIAVIAPLALALAGSAQAQVRIVRGPTPIPSGDARSAGDLTVINEKLAFAIAVQSPAPYGVPRGALVDLAPVVDGQIGRDRVVFADFIPNNWSAWPSTYQRVTVVKDTPDEAVIQSERDWGAAK